ncbi:MAG: hypothetical protein K2W91_03365 [Novosphingobium sp.]|nr:hypothetical protein [Novosphingobium sp.]
MRRLSSFGQGNDHLYYSPRYRYNLNQLLDSGSISMLNRLTILPILGAAITVAGAAISPAIAQTTQATLINPINFELPQAEPRIPILNTAITNPDCAQSDQTAEIVVCGNKPRQSPRLDPEVLLATREADAGDPQPSSLTSAMIKRCDPTSFAGCPSQTAIPLSSIAITTIKATVLAIQGEDWREAFPSPRPNAYDLYSRRRSRQRH